MLVFLLFALLAPLAPANQFPYPEAKAKNAETLQLRVESAGAFKNSLTTQFSRRLGESALRIRSPRRVASASLGVVHTARGAAVLDDSSGSVLYDFSADAQFPLASLTKLMTALVVLDSRRDWAGKITIEEADRREGASPFQVGESVTRRDLFRAMLIGSDNTAAAALARKGAKSGAEFAAAMNARGRRLGLLNTSFADPTGLDMNNVSTAREAAELARVAFGEPAIREASASPAFEHAGGKQKRRVRNTNWLLGSFLNKPPYRIIGGKTGYINESKYNLVLEVEKDGGGRIVVALLGSETANERLQDAKGLAMWAFENYNWE